MRLVSAAWVLGLLVAVTLAPAFDAWQTFGVGDGLPRSAISGVFEDSAGYLWVGTGGGVCR